MADVVDLTTLRRDPEFHNYLNVTRGFTYLGRALHPYTENKLKDLHKRISLKLAGEPPCTQRCSEIYRNDPKRWCRTCTRWKAELESHSKGKQLNYYYAESWNWPQDCKHFLPLYIQWEPSNIDLEDLTTQVAIWGHCNVFHIGRNTSEGIRKTRNKYYGHNPNLHVSKAQKQKCFNIFRAAACYDADVIKYVDGSKCKTELDTIEDDDDPWAPLNKMNDQLIEVNKLVKDIHSDLRRKQDSPPLNYMYICFGFIVVVLICTYAYVRYTMYGHTSNGTSPQNVTTSRIERFGNCLPETFSFPFPNDMELQGYLTDHQQLIGRQWLVKDLEPIVEETFDSKGVLLMAEMGYGKSMIASHIVCCDKDDAWYALRQHLIAYHVCKFDVPSTKNPAVFIKRLVGLISATLPDFRSAIAFKQNGADRFDSQKCEKDPIHCIDQTLLFTLKTVNASLTDPKVILLDALDECFDSSLGENVLLKILRHRLHDFPKWIRFLITSRTSQDIYKHLHGPLKGLELHFNDPRNYEDIRKFVSAQQYSQKVHTSGPLGWEGESFIDKLVSISGGNFLYLTLALDYWSSKTSGVSLSEIPNKLEHIYQLNFERQFGTETHEFDTARVILEIVCVSFNPVSQIEVLEMFKVVLPHIGDQIIMANFKKLAMFLRESRDTGKLTFVHMSLHNWLVSPENKNFHVTINTGHHLISNYIMNQLHISNNISKQTDIVELVIHISISNNSDIIQQFKTIPLGHWYNQTNIHYSQTEHININMQNASMLNDTASTNEVNEPDLHRLVWVSDNRLAVDLLLHHFPQVDVRNEGGVTAAFVASARGHAHALESLIDHGADVSFQVNTSLQIIPMKDKLMFTTSCKTELFCGYGLMDIASQKGHFDMIKLIDRTNSSLKTQHNALGMLPLHLACEFGHCSIVEYLLEPSIGNDTDICFHHAAENGHLHVLEYITRKGISHECVSINDSTSTLKILFSDNDLGNHISIDSLHITNRFPDIVWKALGESPLHAAVKNGHLEVIKFIVASFPNSVNCTDRFGRTPLLLCLAVNCSLDAFNAVILPNDSNLLDTCQEPLPDTSLLKELIVNIYHDEPFCPWGGGVPHMMAKLTRFKGDILQRVLHSNIDLDWQKYDANGLRPIHYAACTKGGILIHYHKQLNISISETSYNGSTVFHLAAFCENIGLVNATIQTHFKRNFFDMYNMTVLHYLFHHDKNVSWAIDHGTFSAQNVLYLFNILLHSYEQNNLIWESADIYGRNALHYALYNGYFEYVYFLLKFKYIPTSSIDVLFDKTDENGMSPIRYTFHRMKPNEKFLHITKFYAANMPVNCSFLYALLDVCDDENSDTAFLNFVSPQEAALAMFLPHTHSTHEKVLNLFYFKDHMFEMLTKSIYLPITVFHMIRNKTAFDFQDALNKAIESRLINRYVVLGVAVYLPEMLVICDKPFKQSPLHMLVQRHDINIKLMFDLILKTYTIHHIDNCIDMDGFNVYHRALESASTTATSYLSGKKFRFVAGKFSLPNVYMIPVIYGTMYMKKHNISDSTMEHLGENIRYFTNTGIQFKDHVIITEGIMFLRVYDFQLYDMLKKTTNDICGIENICSWDARSLSIVHYAAASGMVETLKLIGENSADSLECLNADGITPLYLARVFRQKSAIAYLETMVMVTFPPSAVDTYIRWLVFNKHTSDCQYLQVMPFHHCSAFGNNDHERRKRYRLMLNCTHKRIYVLTHKKELAQWNEDLLLFRGISTYSHKRCVIHFDRFVDVKTKLGNFRCNSFAHVKSDACVYSRCRYIERLQNYVNRLQKTAHTCSFLRGRDNNTRIRLYIRLLESIVDWYIDYILMHLHKGSKSDIKYSYLGRLQHITRDRPVHIHVFNKWAEKLYNDTCVIPYKERNELKSLIGDIKPRRRRPLKRLLELEKFGKISLG